MNATGSRFHAASFAFIIAPEEARRRDENEKRVRNHDSHPTRGFWIQPARARGSGRRQGVSYRVLGKRAQAAIVWSVVSLGQGAQRAPRQARAPGLPNPGRVRREVMITPKTRSTSGWSMNGSKRNVAARAVNLSQHGARESSRIS